jgi:hypothetical protein
MFNLLFSDWILFLAYPNLFEIKGFVVVVVVGKLILKHFVLLFLILILFCNGEKKNVRP